MALGENLISYSVQEDATPIDPNDASAGFGQVTYSRYTKEDEELNIETVSEDGIVKDLASTDGLVNVTVDSRLSHLSRWFTVLPYGGSLSGYATHISKVVSLVPPITVDPAIASRNVLAPGYVGNVWEGTKDFLSANELEITQDLKIQPIRTREAETHNVIGETWNLNAQGTAEKLKVIWRETEGMKTNMRIPLELSEPLSVDANETVEQEITIHGSITSIKQPVPKDSIPANYNPSVSGSAYSVAGSDGLPIEADRWLASGGRLHVELTENPSVIKVIVTGGKVEEYAPYRIAMTSGSSNYYNSLHLAGDGMAWTQHEFTMNTGASASTTSEETAVELDNVNILSLAQAYTGALKAASALRAGIKTVSGTASTVTSPVGARVKRSEAIYRLATTTTGPANVQYDLQPDTLISDFNTVMSGQTFADFNSLFAGYRFWDFSNQPLKRNSL